MRESNSSSITLQTNRGLLTCERTSTGAISVAMGAPLFEWSAVPLAQAMDTLPLPLTGAPAACSMGNPHCTFFVDDLTAIDIAATGPAIESHPLFPQDKRISSRSLIENTFACEFGSAGEAFRWVRAHALAVPLLTAYDVACWTIVSRLNVMAEQ
jgi:hypothetical protein